MGKNGNIVAIVQARMGSTRLPGKVMKELCGRPVLWHVVDRLQRSKKLNRIVVATTVLQEDDVIERFCKKNNILVYRGSSEDVLNRYFEASKKFKANTVIRITSDCPVIDPVILDEMIVEYEKILLVHPLNAYVSNTLKRTFPRGLDVEIFSNDLLENTFLHARSPHEKEHVTPYIYSHPELFYLFSFESEIDYSAFRWTLDTSEDFQLIEQIYKRLYNENQLFLFRDILNLFDKSPELKFINDHVEQKKF